MSQDKAPVTTCVTRSKPGCNPYKIWRVTTSQDKTAKLREYKKTLSLLSSINDCVT